MKLTDYLIPNSLDEAHRMLKDLGPEGLPVAGATSHGFMNPNEQRIGVDLSRTGLNRIQPCENGWSVGAMTTIDQLYRHHGDGWVMNEIADAFVTQQIRNISTIGGNITRVFPWSDFPVVLLALDASMVISGNANHTMMCDDYFKGQPARHFQPGDLLTEIRVNALPSGTGFAYVKQRRTEADFGQATAATRVALTGRKFAEVRIALGAAVALPVRLRSLEEALIGKNSDEQIIRDAVVQHLAVMKFRSVAGMSEEYIGQVARVMVGDAIIKACSRAGGQT